MHTVQRESHKGEKLFSVTAKDLEIQFFRAGGKGGQKQNKTSSACRIIHPASGAVGESREERSQAQNKKTAFLRMTQTPLFQGWLRAEISAVTLGHVNAERLVDEQMREENLKIETYDPTMR